MDELAFEAVFNADEAMRDACRWVIWSASQALGCGSASIHELYLARGRGEFDATRFTVPAINVRASTYLTARQAFAAALERDAGAVIFEIAKSRDGVHRPAPGRVHRRRSWPLPSGRAGDGPVFLQGDHFQFNATKWRDDPDAEMAGPEGPDPRGDRRRLPEHRHRQQHAGRPVAADVAAQQAVNAANTVELTLLIRDLQPDGVTISVGGEIGEVGKANSTEEELRAYLDGYFGSCTAPACRASARSASRPGPAMAACALPDGIVAEVSIDFDTLRRLSTVAREEYGLAGAVQHGASTLPDEAFHHFPANGTAEIHLATGFQNILYDEPGLPAELRAEMMAWCLANCADERKDGETDEQFLYKTRKKALGPVQAAALDGAGRRPGADRRQPAAQVRDPLRRARHRRDAQLVDRYVRRRAATSAARRAGRRRARRRSRRARPSSRTTARASRR